MNIGTVARLGLRRSQSACLGMMLLAGPFTIEARPAPRAPNTIRELYQFLHQCVSLPAGTEGSELTLRFSLDHLGALRGKPMITYSKLTGDVGTQKRFVSAALDALEKCTPVPVTEQFGRLLGQRVLTWRFVHRGRDQRTI